jgi:anti-sigma regulatory factor (Ser/Thr protein kinase)
MTQDETEVPRSHPPGIDLSALPLTGVREPETTCAKPMPSHRRRFDGRPDQVLLARQFVVSALVEDSPIRDVARLLVSEVTTNALRHTASGTARGGFRVSYELRDDQLRVEVYDAGALTTPQRRAHDLEAPGGRGLELLDALASRWGTLGGPEGRVVWFELDLGASRSRGRHPSGSELDR